MATLKEKLARVLHKQNPALAALVLATCEPTAFATASPGGRLEALFEREPWVPVALATIDADDPGTGLRWKSALATCLTISESEASAILAQLEREVARLCPF